MRVEQLTLIAPEFEPCPLSEAEVMGSAVWLWMNSDMHLSTPLHLLNGLMIPAIKSGQYLLAFENEKPVAYVAWARLDEINESGYLKDPLYLNDTSQWQSGDRAWITDFIAPFGHAKQIRHLMTNQLFINGLFRTLYHKGDTKGLRILELHGIGMHPIEVKHWLEEHPINTELANSDSQ